VTSPGPDVIYGPMRKLDYYTCALKLVAGLKIMVNYGRVLFTSSFFSFHVQENAYVLILYQRKKNVISTCIYYYKLVRRENS